MFKLFIDRLHTDDTQSFDCDTYETAIGIAKDAVYPTLKALDATDYLDRYLAPNRKRWTGYTDGLTISCDSFSIEAANTANKHTKVFTVKLKTRDRDLNDFLITIEKD